MLLNSPCFVYRENDQALRATIVQQRRSEYYVHYDGLDKRLDEWVPMDAVEIIRDPPTVQTLDSEPQTEGATRGKKRNRTAGPTAAANSDNTLATLDRSATPQDDPPTLGPSLHTRDQTEAAQQHNARTTRRNFDQVHFDQWSIKTWYFSPYPSFDDEAETHTRPRATPDVSGVGADPAGPGVRPAAGLATNTAIIAAHNIAGAAATAGAGDATLWVCDRCFKYMRDSNAWEIHKKTCKIIHPPGRKVYQRGAHTIWEVDGQVERLYSQNLSLFGKLFIDVKTLFFDTEHFMFYILTDADAHRDHFLAYFSQEKVSYDDYNLACIVTLPPYQKRGYGMLLIEFSYELSRRAGKLGTPERPLSDLGLRSYVAFWIAVLVRFFRTITPTPDKDEEARLASSTSVEDATQPSREAPSIGEAETEPHPSTVPPPGQLPQSNVGTRLSSTLENGRPPHGLRVVDAFGEVSYHSRPDPDNPDSAGALHRNVRCSLDDIAQATHLRPDDIAFALREAGLLTKRHTIQEGSRRARLQRNAQNSSGSQTDRLASGEPPSENNNTGIEDAGVDQLDLKSPRQLEIVITRHAIEALARERRVKPPYLDRAYVLL